MIQQFKALRNIHRNFDDACATLEQTLGTSICIAKCGRCCSTVSCMTIEALNIVSYLLGQGQLASTLQAAEDWLVTRHSEAPSYEGMIAGRFVPPKIRDEWYDLSQMQCPFLSTDLTCTIHEVRPLVCRSYGVTRRAGVYCPRPLSKNESYSKQGYIDSPELRADVEHFCTTTKRKNPEWAIRGFLPTMLYRAARDAEFRKLIKDNRIASAKVIGMDVDVNIMWQPQVEALHKGVLSELAVLSH